MLLKLTLLLAVSFLYFTVSAQLAITGKVLDAKTGLPVSGASVFLNNATKGTMTDEEGKFNLANITEAQYDMVISFVGYQTYTKNIAVNNQLKPMLIELTAKMVSLKEVNIYPTAVRNRYLELFKRNFIGTSENAASCKILNPDIINFKFDKPKDLLEASTDEFLVIENKALGYRLKFLLDQFSISNLSSFSVSVYFEGPVLFEIVDGNNSKRKYWKKNRLHCYEGSSMHFFRSAGSESLHSQGFVIHKLIRKPNANRPADDLIQSKILYYSTIKSTPSVKDSLQSWQRKSGMPKTIQYLLPDTLNVRKFIRPTDQQGIHALTFEDLLYVEYDGKKNEHLSPQNGGGNALPYSIMSLKEEYAFFDNNGIVTNPQSILFEGYWAIIGKIADMLPSDYAPGD